MTSNALQSIGFILYILFNLYALLVAVRFVMQALRVSFHNPMAEAIVRLTNPLVIPLRRIVPSVSRYDTASLVLLFAVLFVKLLMFKYLGLGIVLAIGRDLLVTQLPLANLVLLGLLDVIYVFFNVFIFALFITAIMSWVPGAAGSPMHAMVSSISEPVTRPLRKLIPPMGGLDLTVFFTIIGLIALRKFVFATLIPLVSA